MTATHFRSLAAGARARGASAGLLALVAAASACGGAADASRTTSRPLLRDIRAHAPAPVKIERVEIAPTSASAVNFARIAKYPEPGWNVPRQTQHAPDGKTLTFLASEAGDETMSLFAFDGSTGKTELLLRAKDLDAGASGAAARSREEELRRERQRDRNEGITNHLWAKRAKLLVLPHAGDVFVRDFTSAPGAGPGAVRRLTKTPEPELDPRPCDTGERIAFVRSGELFSIDVATGKETQLTKPAPGVTHGLSDFVAQEELGEPSGFFWSPTCDRLAYLEVDERPVDELPILGYRGQPDLMMQRYPRAGAKNPLVRAGIVDVATRRTTWLDWKSTKTAPAGEAASGKAPTAAGGKAATPAPERYLGRFTWSPDGKALFVQSMTRDQKRVALVRVDPVTGAATELAVETSPAWVSFSPVRMLQRSDGLVLASNRTGRRHLEVRSRTDGALVRALTSGDWDVESISGIDEAGGRVLFTATKDGALERHLYAAPLAAGGAGDVTRLTTERGVHSVRVDETGTTWLDVHSATDRPPRAVVVREGRVVGELPIPLDADVAALDLRPVEHVTVKAADGATLHGALLRPRKITGRHPAIVMVYGGPEAQLVFDSWAPRLLWQHLADRGFVVFQLDNRGSGGQGRAFAQKVHKQLGKLELEDQIAGASFLANLPFVDASRVGIYGHSYGGFMAALAMLDGKGVFRAGVAGAPVTDWRLYDTGYTERYMETPEVNPGGYDAADLAKKAAGLTGKLMLSHALMDENVHFAHTARLIDALIAANRPFDLLVLPGERHGLRVPAVRAYVPERVAQFFADNL
ncbi:MAG: alpha/beta fold hydrolase [Labilithrix sp.]|nr:alpha/beta fold hydrolase [Labilithrix sp.]